MPSADGACVPDTRRLEPDLGRRHARHAARSTPRRRRALEIARANLRREAPAISDIASKAQVPNGEVTVS